ncbi:MAG: ribosome assembly RNA-binding protein YhbY [Lachnospiraceae bacterium]|nr:ribosome assembly RNA-binding protein YhbY [Lachnospiraceae bacterium]
MNNKQRAYLSGLASKLTPIMQIGKSSLTPEIIRAADEALEARELIKISVLKNCFDDPRAIAEMMAERTHSEVVRVIGKKIVLYRAAKKPKIELPK